MIETSSREFFFRCGGPACVALLAVICGATPAPAKEADLRQELRTVARSVTKLLTARGQNSIAIGQLTGPPNFPSSAGSGLLQTLTEEFSELGIAVKKRANYGLKCEFSATKVRRPDPKNSFRRIAVLAVKFRGSVVDEFGEIVTDFNLNGDVAEQQIDIDNGEFSKEIEGEENFVQLIGSTVNLPASDLPAERAERLQQSLVDPENSANIHIAGQTQLFAGQDSPYGIQLLSGPAPKSGNAKVAPTPIKLEDGLPHVQLDQGDVYQVRLINNSNFDAAVKLTIDGLSVFSFSEVKHTSGPRKGEPRYSVYIVRPHSTLTVMGWHLSNELVASFLVTSYEESAAARLGHESNLGTVTATFAAAWPANQKPPADEPSTPRGAPRATGFGPPRKQIVQEFRRQVGVIRAGVTLRYSKET